MNGSARPVQKTLLYRPPFDMTDRLEARQQTPVLPRTWATPGAYHTIVVR
jgi:hypothetical protein